jgi:polysaccharide export outer membrane protein
MRSSRFVLLAVAAVALAGCMQTGGSGIFARNAPPLTQNHLVLPAVLRPAPVRTATPPVVAQPVEAQPMMPQPIAPQPVMLAPEETGYTLDSGDKLRVVVFGQDGLSASYSVDTGGSITMPLIGAVAARGHTPAQLQAAIAAKLRQGYVREPHVAVEVETYRPFFILGEVTLPGQ